MEKNHLTIAIVDDHDLLREQLRSFIILIGHEVVLEAHNMLELFDQLPLLERLPDLCLLDVAMPVTDGCDTIRLLRAQYPAIKILAFSLFTGNEEIKQILSCGANGFLPKENTTDFWVKTINSYRSAGL